MQQDPDVVLANLRQTIARMDDTMDRASDIVDKAAVRMAVAVGATDGQLQTLLEHQSARKAAKVVARDGPTSAKQGEVDAKPLKKKGWQAPQDATTRAKALSYGAPAAPSGLERCWDCFTDLPPACPCDWLAKGQPGERDRPGQPMKRFLQPGPHRSFPTTRQQKIYLLPLGNVAGAPDPRVFCELLRRWFLLEVELLPKKTVSQDDLARLQRDKGGCGYGPQLENPSAFDLLRRKKPKDAFVLLAYTMEDICDTAKGFGFLFGQANLDLGVGLFSFARYGDDVDARSPRFLRRCGMVLCHEATHLLGIKHCVYACCVMNGSNHLEESESRPFALCPVDLRKVQLTLDQAKLQGRNTPPVDLAARERGLIAFFEEHGLHDDARFSRGILAALTGESLPDFAEASREAEVTAAALESMVVAHRQQSDELRRLEQDIIDEVAC